MKKLFVAIVTLMAVSAVQAQSLKDEILASVKNSEQLQELLGKQPKACGEDEIDAYKDAIVAVANQAVENSKNLKAIYDKMEAGEDPTALLEDAKKLKDGVDKEGKDFKDATTKAEGAAKKVADLGNEVATANALAKVKAAKKLKNSTSVLDYSKDCSKILVKESVNQAGLTVKITNELTGLLKKKK